MQDAVVVVLRARPRTPHRAGQCVLVAKASIFNSLLQPDPDYRISGARLTTTAASVTMEPGLRRTPTLPTKDLR